MSKKQREDTLPNRVKESLYNSLVGKRNAKFVGSRDSLATVMKMLVPVTKRLQERMQMLLEMDKKIKDLQHLRDEIKKIYPELGPYRSIAQIDKEIEIFTKGTIPPNGNIPKRVPIIVASQDIAFVATFGRGGIGALSNSINSVTTTSDNFGARPPDRLIEAKKSIIQQISQSEHEHLMFLEKTKKALSEYYKLYAYVDPLLPPGGMTTIELTYNHTYVFMKPFVIMSAEEMQKAGFTFSTDVDVRIQNTDYIRVTPRQPNGNPFALLPKEVAPGYDEYGMLLELTNHAHTREESSTVTEEVLIDHGSKRKVHHLFVDRHPDLLKVLNWALNDWDMLRDDLRDGRYHPESHTLADYTIAALLGHDTLKMVENKKPKHIESEFVWDVNGKVLSKATDGKPLRRRPADKNPAFDLRDLTAPFVHFNRKHYYESLSDHWVDELIEGRKINTTPFLSTRGMSAFVISMMLRRSMDLDTEMPKLRNLQIPFDFGGDTYTDNPLH